MIMWSLHRSHSQIAYSFGLFNTNLEKLVTDVSCRNVHFLQVTCNFNNKSADWFINDTTTSEGAQLDSLMTLCCLKNLITKQRHILENSPNCIDPILPKIAMNSWLLLTLQWNCHQQIICSKLDVKIEYPPPYTRESLNYNSIKTD